MERKKNLQKMKSMLIIVLGLILNQSIKAIDIVGFTLNTGTVATGVSVATSGLATNSGATMTTVGATTLGFSDGTGQTCYNFTTVGTSGWNTTIFSTAFYNKLTIGFQMKSTGTGPRDFQGQYSINGSTYYNIPDDATDVTDNPAFSLTTGFQNYKFILPAECNNKTNLHIRWVVRTSSKTNGTAGSYGLTSTASATLYGITVQGELFVAPTSQAKDISIRSVTPTTITVGCSHGTGNRRVLYMNTTNNFTAPIDDTPFGTPNTTYTSGQQLVYDGIGDQVTVTVPDSKNIYWFKYYEYNMLDQLIKVDVNFLNSDGTTAISGNPKECKLESIHSPTAAFGLTRATLSAIIDIPTKSAIRERGFYFSTDPNVNDTDNGVLINEQSTEGGPFSLPIPGGVDRATTIYFKAYVINASGKILSEEASFDNTPVFSGTGNWETPARWNVGEVPGVNGDATYGSVNDSPFINGTCTLGTSNEVTNLTINAGNSLAISAGTLMKVDGLLTNSAGASGIVVQANTSCINGSLVFGSGTPQATVEMYSKAKYNLSLPAGSKYTWQYFGIPFTSLAYSPKFDGAFVRKWDESVTSYSSVWVKDNNGTSLMLASGSTLEPGKGYELVQSSNKKYSFTGTLVHSDFSQSLPYTPTAYYKGQTILSNPYTAAMDVSAITFGANTDASIYLYNTGTFNDWSTGNGQNTPGSGPGTYTVTTKGSIGLDGVPTQIPSMQGFLVKSTAVGGGSISYSYSSLINNSERQRVKSVAATTKIGTMIDVIGTNYSDRMWLLDDVACTKSFDNGYDGSKLLGFDEVSQLYGMEADGIYQIDAVNDLNNTFLGFQPGTETSFKLVFKHQNIDLKYSKMYLVDFIANSTTDITQTGTEYSFTSTATDVVKRFKILATTGTTTRLDKNSESSSLNIFNSDNTIVINNKSNFEGKLTIFDTMGRLLKVSNFGSNAITNIITNLGKGTYIVKAVVNSEKTSKCIILN